MGLPVHNGDNYEQEGYPLTKPKLMSITYSEEMPEESAIILYRLIEKLILESLPLDPHMIGLFVEESMDEFKNK